mmetsp:Transcript_41770/g.66354  ORF Transcript_41770/g.66354 Transcript_41770/m.66354 type:complete len:80 (-) Transcript_41770:43-282(-)
MQAMRFRAEDGMLEWYAVPILPSMQCRREEAKTQRKKGAYRCCSPIGNGRDKHRAKAFLNELLVAKFGEIVCMFSNQES